MAVTTEQAQWKTYSNAALGVSIEYPAKWMFEESPAVGVVVFADEKALKNQTLTPFSPVVNMITQKIPGLDLEIYSQQQLGKLKEMAGPDVKVEKNAKLGEIPAHKALTSMPLPDGSAIKFFALWAYTNGIGYSFFFHCPSADFAKYSKVLSHMLSTFEAKKILPLSFALKTYSDHGFLVRYPVDWEEKVKTDMSAKGPVVTLSHEEKEKDNVHQTTVKISLVPKQGPLQVHVDLLKDQLEKMLVDKVELINTTVGSRPACVAKWQSDATQKGMRYMQLFTTETDTDVSPIVTVALNTNVPIGEYDQVPQLFDMIRGTFSFLSDSALATKTTNWSAFHHLKFGFGFLFDQAKYVWKPDGIPLTEASFYREGDDPMNPLVNFSIIVRALDEGEKPDLVKMGEELQENLRQVCGNTLETVSAENSKVGDSTARVLICHGTAQSPLNPAEVEEMYFVYKYLINTSANTAILFAFASTPKYWQKEWKVVESYIDTLYWC